MISNGMNVPLVKTPEDIFVLSPTLSRSDKELITRAFNFARQAHEGQTRYSGEPYFNHVFETARLLAKLGLDANTIAAGLLHDSVEDTPVTANDLEKEFGSEILFLVEGVTKLGTIRFKGAERHVGSLRKLFVATSQDIRVLLIKLADRLHNMRTLQFVPEEKQTRIASETMHVYAPLAHRLNIGQITGELEDLSFQYLEPEKYNDIHNLMEERVEATEDTLATIDKKLLKAIAKEKIKLIKTDYRKKHLWSLYRKLKKKDMDIGRIYDILALRIIVSSVSECYQVLGIVHSLWRPLPGRVKDYIAFQKPNGYQSIHTTIFTGEGGLAEIQIRTEKMHQEAEFGVASHFSYKNKKNRLTISPDWFKSLIDKNRKELTSQPTNPPDWMRDLASFQDDDEERKKFIDSLKEDFINQRIFVFTPHGDVIDLPKGSYPLDFAYHVHTSIGNHTAGAKINGKMSKLDTELKNGDIVKIETGKNSRPTQKWLNFTKTTLARRKIKSYLAQENSG